MFSRKWRSYLSLSLSLPLLFLFSFSVARARARTRETPRCISSIFKRHGLSVPRGSASIYKASGRLLLSAAFFSRELRWPRQRREARQYTRESVVESIPCRRAAFYLRPPYAFSFRLTLVLYPFPPSLPSIILHRSSRLRHPSSRFRTCFLPSFLPSSLSPSLRGSSTLDRSDGRWLQSYMPLSRKITKSFSFLAGKSPAKTFYYFCAYNMYAC